MHGRLRELRNYGVEENRKLQLEAEAEVVTSSANPFAVAAGGGRRDNNSSKQKAFIRRYGQ